MQVAHTTLADFRVFGVLADVFAHMPASPAFGVAQCAAFEFFLGTAHQAGFRADEDKAQVVAERSQNVVLFTVGINPDLGL